MCSLCSTFIKSVLRQVAEPHVLHSGSYRGHVFWFGVGGFGRGVRSVFGVFFLILFVCLVGFF